jgi:hypothetical protein
LVDALRSGRSELTLVKVQVLSSPPSISTIGKCLYFLYTKFMKINQKGFGALETFLILIIVGGITFIGFRVMHKTEISSHNNSPANTSASEPVGTYSMSLDANQDKNFKNYYSLNMKPAKQNFVPDGVSNAKISVLNTSVANSSNGEIDIKASIHKENWTRPDCSGIEPWSCGPPSVESKLDLPMSALGKSNPAPLKFVIEVDGKKDIYSIDRNNYKLTALASGKVATNTVPFYPDGIAEAIAVNIQKNSLCENITSAQIQKRISGSSIELASKQYPGIEKVRPDNVLVAAGKNKFFDTVIPPDSSGCGIKIIAPNLKQL